MQAFPSIAGGMLPLSGPVLEGQGQPGPKLRIRVLGGRMLGGGYRVIQKPNYSRDPIGYNSGLSVLGDMTLRVLIVDDSEAIRKALRMVLNGYHGVEVVGEAADGQEAILQAQKLTPDLIIMDVGMPFLDGLSATAIVKKVRPDVRILIFTMFDVPTVVASAKKIGADGFVSKDGGTDGLLRAVDAVLQHHSYFPALP